MNLSFPKTRLRRRKDVQAELRATVSQLRNRAGTKLHLGCGEDYIEGLVNIDLYAPRADVRTAVTDLSKFESGTVEYIEANHVIEHLTFEETESALAEWARVLAPGGWIVVSCPDLDRIVRRWKQRPAERKEWLRMIYGSQEHPGMFHKSGYNAELLRALFARHGLSPEFTYTPFPARPTPSLCIFARKQ